MIADILRNCDLYVDGRAAKCRRDNRIRRRVRRYGEAERDELARMDKTSGDAAKAVTLLCGVPWFDCAGTLAPPNPR